MWSCSLSIGLSAVSTAALGWELNLQRSIDQNHHHCHCRRHELCTILQTAMLPLKLRVPHLVLLWRLARFRNPQILRPKSWNVEGIWSAEEQSDWKNRPRAQPLVARLPRQCMCVFFVWRSRARSGSHSCFVIIITIIIIADHRCGIHEQQVQKFTGPRSAAEASWKAAEASSLDVAVCLRKHVHLCSVPFRPPEHAGGGNGPDHGNLMEGWHLLTCVY